MDKIPIRDYEGLYCISKDGTVTSLLRKSTKNLTLKHHLNGNGYPHVCLTKNGKSKFLVIHRLLANHFIPNPNNYPEINHINGIKTDFSLNNLEWCTHLYNMQHAVRTGLLVPRPTVVMLSDSEIIELYARYRSGEKSSDLAKEYNIPSANLISIFCGSSRRKLKLKESYDKAKSHL